MGRIWYFLHLINETFNIHRILINLCIIKFYIKIMYTSIMRKNLCTVFNFIIKETGMKRIDKIYEKKKEWMKTFWQLC